MPGDISRETAPRARRGGFSRVRMQQGRVQLDADWNEQVELVHDRARVTARDALGPGGVPIATPDAFAIGDLRDGDFGIGAGRFYLDGLVVENTAPRRYRDQPFLPDPGPVDDVVPGDEIGLVFLAVFEREVTALEDDRLRERALGGADTTTRTQTVWQVRVMPLADTGLSPLDVIERVRRGEQLDVPAWRPPADGAGLQVRVDPGAVAPDDQPCLIAPDAGFLGMENQLYRVEVHRGGVVGGPGTAPTFKWSRDNASVAVVIAPGSDGLVLETDRRVGEDDFPTAAWVELVHTAQELARAPGHLAQVRRPAGGPGVVLDPPPSSGLTGLDNPRVRRWDQQVAAATPEGLPVTGGFDALEAGIEVRFAPGTYLPGDHWLIPARTATGNVEWPPDGAAPDAVVPPLGRDVGFHPLALVTRNRTDDLRTRFHPLVTLAPGQPTAVETSTVAPVLQRLDRPDTDEETAGWATGVGVAFTRTAEGTARRVDGVMAAALPPRGRVRSLRVVGTAGTDRGELHVSLLRLAVASTVPQTVVEMRIPLAPGPLDATAALATGHVLDGEGSRYVLRALAVRPPRTGSFVTDDVRLHAVQITYTPG